MFLEKLESRHGNRYGLSTIREKSWSALENRSHLDCADMGSVLLGLCLLSKG